jgi:hypothetical protein
VRIIEVLIRISLITFALFCSFVNCNSGMGVMQFGLRDRPVQREILRYARKTATLRMPPNNGFGLELNLHHCLRNRQRRYATVERRERRPGLLMPEVLYRGIVGMLPIKARWWAMTLSVLRPRTFSPPPPCENISTWRSSFTLVQRGHLGRSVDMTSVSNRWLHRLQMYSKIGMA